MAKQIRLEERKKIPMNLVQGEFWSRRHAIPDGVLSQPNVPKTYYELRQFETTDGIVEKLVEVDYPITPDYVKSFQATADYRNDLETAMNSPARGQNVGDCTNIQEVLGMDLTAVREMQAKLSKVAESLTQTQTQTQTQSEVVNNG